MKHLIGIFLIALCVNTQAQTVLNGKHITELKQERVKYIKLFMVEKVKSIDVYVDYGQQHSYTNWKGNHFVCNKTGDMVSFFSKIEVLNFFSAHGWDLEETIATSNGSISSFILSRKDIVLKPEDFE